MKTSKELTMSQIFQELNDMDLDLNYSENHKISELNYDDCYNMAESLMKKGYPLNDDAVQFYINKANELLRSGFEKGFENISKNW